MVDFDEELLEAHMSSAEHEQYRAHANKRKPDISPTLSHLRSVSPDFEAALLFASKAEKRKLRRLYWGMSKEQRQEMVDSSFFPDYGEDHGGGVQSYKFANGRVILMRPLTPEEQEGPYPEPSSKPAQTGGHIHSGLAGLLAKLTSQKDPSSCEDLTEYPTNISKEVGTFPNGIIILSALNPLPYDTSPTISDEYVGPNHLIAPLPKNIDYSKLEDFFDQLE